MSKAETSFPLSWHKTNNENSKNYLALREAELARLSNALGRLRADVRFREQQIEEAERRGLDKFDADRFLRKRPERGRVERMSKPAMSMIEVVARAICRDIWRPEVGEGAELEDYVDMRWTDWVSLARAAIAALRVPTGAMKELGQQYQDEEYPMTSEAFWQTMIDAALAEPTTGE